MAASALLHFLQIDNTKMKLQRYIKLFMEKYATCQRMEYVFETPVVQNDALQEYCAKYRMFATEYTDLKSNIISCAEGIAVTKLFFCRCRMKYEELR